jgi:hypothetical protein
VNGTQLGTGLITGGLTALLLNAVFPEDDGIGGRGERTGSAPMDTRLPRHRHDPPMAMRSPG